jgi:hypothetical protein
MNSIFKKYVATIISVAYFIVFILGTAEATPINSVMIDGKTNTTESKNNAKKTSLEPWTPTEYDFSGGRNWDTYIILGIAVAVVAVVLIVRSANHEKTTELSKTDSTLASPSSWKSITPKARTKDSTSFVSDTDSMFEISLQRDSLKEILNERISITYELSNSKSAICFRNIVGVSSNLNGSFEQKSIYIKTDDVFYLIIKAAELYQIKVAQENGNKAVLIFTKK